MAMKLKTNADGQAVLTDGKPVYVWDDGHETAVDVEALFGKISALNEESKNHRLAAKEAKAKLAEYEDLDPAEAREAMRTVQNLSAKKLVDAGEVEKVKAAVSEGWQKKLDEAKKEQDRRDAIIRRLTVGNAFRSSPVIGKLVIPPDMAEAFFGGAFEVDGDRVIGKLNGSPIMSRANPGEPAAFDEALEVIIGAYPNRQAILKGTPTGTGAGGGIAPTGKRPADYTTAEKLAFIQQQGPEAWGKLVASDSGRK